MNEIQFKSEDLLDTTDCLGAVSVFKGWKNLFFVIMALCLLLQQASFWLVDRDCIALSGEANSQPSRQSSKPEPDVSGFSSFDSRIQHAVACPSGSFLSSVTFEKLTCLIRFVNTVLILTAPLYCLTLLFGLMVSMHGRMGGINHIGRAFFLSLILLVLLLPWQMVFGNMVTGAIYTLGELAQWCAKENKNIFDLILYYMRFTGFGALMLLLLIFSQIHSVRWAKAILLQLEII